MIHKNLLYEPKYPKNPRKLFRFERERKINLYKVIMYYHFKDKQNVNSQHSKFFQIFCFKEKEENSLMMPSYLAKLKKLVLCGK